MRRYICDVCGKDTERTIEYMTYEGWHSALDSTDVRDICPRCYAAFTEIDWNEIIKSRIKAELEKGPDSLGEVGGK